VNTTITNEIFALLIIVLGAGLLLAGKITDAEWVQVVEWIGIAAITGKSAQVAVNARSAKPQQAQPPQP
jgi:threonine/homoserine efflux transporter RhtA